MDQPNSCGTCRLCCTVMRVEQFPPPEPDKPAMVACQHLCKQGCGIYERRPVTCSGFECVWLTSQQWGKLALPSSERPDRTGVIMTVNSKGTVTAHCKTPQAWKGDRAHRRLQHYNNVLQSSVTIEHGDGTCSVLEKNGSATQLEHIGVDPDTNENMYQRPK